MDYPFLLQSVADHPSTGRYDILFAFPSAHLACCEQQLWASTGVPILNEDFFESLSAWVKHEGPARGTGTLPFAGGWFLFLGYEMARQVEPGIRLPISPYRFPDALAVRCPAAIVYDRDRQEIHLLAESNPALLERLACDLDSVRSSSPGSMTLRPLVLSIEEEPEQRFMKGVHHILEYLRAGDLFQVNLSRSWSGRLAPEIAASEIYERLRVCNPAPFAGIARWESGTVISSSPERLVALCGREVHTRPIAGTRPRGNTPRSDQELRTQLRANLKERAEHIMLIDLERNDLGRVCEAGSIQVSELMGVESYAHVHHIVSKVRGRLRSNAAPGDVLKAVFPGGTITGCPKVRAMEVIAELEGTGRGP
ncbi:MAG: chorismate-binding protein, partial [Nevskiales bacterium]|nr:chorismate-binding protein [Nevskiales bacterium]